jgi:Tol biopolymer transport system component
MPAWESFATRNPCNPSRAPPTCAPSGAQSTARRGRKKWCTRRSRPLRNGRIRYGLSAVMSRGYCPCLAATALAAALCFAPPAAAQGPTTYRTKCGVELRPGLPETPGGPVCGTDEGDDVYFGGEDGGLSFFGENGHDTVEGTRYDDAYGGGPGNDEIHGGRGGDQIDGGDDSDVVFGGLGDDVIRERRFGVRESFYGGPGSDTIAGGRGTDNLYGGTGNDVLLGGTGSDRLYGGPGDDTLYGGPNRDVFDCGPGNDTVYRVRRSAPGRGSLGRADGGIPRSAGCEKIVTGDSTADFALSELLGSSGRDTIAGGGGDDLIQGKGAGDRLFGGSGNDELEGDGAESQGDDLLMGGSGSDRLAGRAGSDKIYGDARSLNAGPPGRDELVGGSGADQLVAGPGDDLVVGAYDGDRILAGAGHDVITLLGGDTSDPNKRATVFCGRGFDVVVINPARRGSFRECEFFAEQFHEADFGHFFRPSPEAFPAGVVSARAPRAPARARRSQPAPPPAPADPAGGASSPSISGDGSYVAFSSDAPNLVQNDVNEERTDVFVRDFAQGRTLLADATRSGRSPDRGARLRRGPGGGLSADGRFAVFSSNTGQLAGRVSAYGIFRRDVTGGGIGRACRGAGNDDSESPVISPGGAHIAFESRATNLAGADRNQQTDVYWCDVGSGEMRRVSEPLEDNVNSVGSSLQPSISADGRYVAFTSDGGGLVAGDGDRAGVYWRDMQTGETRLVDVPAGANASNGNGMNPKISWDGRYVAFDSDATDLPGGELNGRAVDVFRKDMTDGSVVMVSQGQDGSGADGESTADSISADGSVVAYTSNASNLVPGDVNGRGDVFVRRLGEARNSRVSLRQDGAEPSGPSSSGAISGDGRFVAFASRAPDLVSGAAPSARPRVYRKDLATGAVEQASVGLNLAPVSLVGEPSGVNLRRKVRLIAGTASDNGRVAAVDVAASRSVGKGKCQWLGRGGSTSTGPCSRPVWLRAKLTTSVRFTLRIGRLLPRGSWTVRSRATDDTGQAEAQRAGLNVVTFRLR